MAFPYVRLRTLKPETVELLLKVKETILEEPLRFNMDYIRHMHSQAPCGTTCCIAGWMHVITHPDSTPEGLFWRTARGYIMSASEIASEHGVDERLFFAFRWPENIKTAYILAKTPRDKAAAGAMAIDSYVAANGNW